MKPIIVLISLWLIATGGLFAQKGLEVNANTAGVFGLEYNFNQRFSVGARVETAKADARYLTPFVKAYLKNFNDASLYIGAGLKGLDPLADFSIPIGIRATPFGESSNFAFTIELENVFDVEYHLRPSIGLSYRFGK